MSKNELWWQKLEMRYHYQSITLKYIKDQLYTRYLLTWREQFPLETKTAKSSLKTKQVKMRGAKPQVEVTTFTVNISPIKMLPGTTGFTGAYFKCSQTFMTAIIILQAIQTTKTMGHWQSFSGELHSYTGVATAKFHTNSLGNVEANTCSNC